MTVLVGIIVILFATLFLLVPMLEKHGRERSPDELQKISRWMTPLMVIMIIAMAIRYFLG
ncbi:MAG TPA: hypothetical protein EYG31_11780 [Porticoccaceae bacterium]|jgi:hypothetical protein|nr:hypothetical protein [Gammaproteobacteria bacterium]HIL61306.1 hypothetical protein [Porticoccaceae bacterium]